MKHLHLKNGWYYYVKSIAGKVKWFPLRTRDEGEALRLWAQIEADPSKLSKQSVECLGITFQALSDRYRGDILKNKCDNTLKSYSIAISSLQEALGTVPVASITRPMVIRYHKSLSENPYAANRDVRVLSVILQYALDLGIIETNPAFYIKKYKESKIELRLNEDILREISEVAGADLQKAIMFAYHLAQHENEVKNLKWGDIDTKSHTLNFVRQKTGQKIVYNYAENIHFSKFLNWLLTERKDLFPHIIHKNGKPYSSFKNLWAKALKKAGLEGYMFKEIRHLANNRMKQENVPVEKRMAVTGHQTIATNERYCHRTGNESIEGSRTLGLFGDFQYTSFIPSLLP